MGDKSAPVVKVTYALRHLPSRGQNIFYVLFLVLSPVLNTLINQFALVDFRLLSRHAARHPLADLNQVSEVSGQLFGILLLIFGISLVLALQRRQRRIRKSLFLFGAFSSVYLLINLCMASYGIFAFKVESTDLLVISAGLYVSLNIVFLFWYWYFDYPAQVRRLHHSESPCQISFPANKSIGKAAWVPSFLDYLYLTIMVSNTLGPPEDHSPVGDRVKVVQLVRSTAMLVLLVIFVSRAINTLV